MILIIYFVLFSFTGISPPFLQKVWGELGLLILDRQPADGHADAREELGDQQRDGVEARQRRADHAQHQQHQQSPLLGQLHPFFCLIRLQRQAVLYRQAHEEEVAHRHRRAVKAAQQHSDIPLTDDEEHSLHQDQQDQHDQRDKPGLRLDRRVYFFEQSDSYLQLAHIGCQKCQLSTYYNTSCPFMQVLTRLFWLKSG